MKSIAFVVGKILRVVELDSDVNKVIDIVSILRGADGFLALSDKMQEVVQAFEPQMMSADDLKLIVLPSAGFTDTRVVYMWLKSFQLWGDKKVTMYKVGEVSLETYSDFETMLKQVLPSDVLEYGREPSIGVKKI